jgi:hypothetical protein
METFFESRLFARMAGVSAAILAVLFGWAAIDQGALSVLGGLLIGIVAGTFSDWANTPPWAFYVLALLFEIYRRMD